MTTLSLPIAPVGKAHPHPGGVLRSELTKFRSVRSSYWSMAATATVTIGLAALHHPDNGRRVLGPEPSRTGRLRRHQRQPRRAAPRTTGNRCPRRARDHLRVLHRAHPHQPGRRATPAHVPVRQGRRHRPDRMDRRHRDLIDGVRHRPGNPPPRTPRRLTRRSRRGTSRPRRRRVHRRHRSGRPRTRRRDQAHRGHHRRTGRTRVPRPRC